MKKLVSLLLVGALSLSLAMPAFAAPSAYPDNSGHFPKIQEFVGYDDVGSGDWFYTNVGICTEIGLMQGTDKGFNPNGILTRAEVVTLAARILATVNGEDIDTATDGPWYQPYADYLKGKDVTLSPALESAATREDFILLLAEVVPYDLLTPINNVTALPDTSDGQVLMLYNAGILTGTDGAGTFAGDKTLTRAEAAAMVSRIARDTLRLPFSPPTLCETLTGLPDDTVLFSDGAGISITLGEGVPYVVQSLTEIAQILAKYGMEFTPDIPMTANTTSGMETTNLVIQKAALAAWAQSLLPNEVLNVENQTLLDSYTDDDYKGSGYTPATLRAAMLLNQRLNALTAGYDDAADFKAWQEANGKLCAKHILVADLETAQKLYDQLVADPSQFDVLMWANSIDAGSKAQPDGYAFGPGEMIAEFETAVAGLEVGEMSAPVQSQYGYHIILRLDYPMDGYQAERLAADFDAYWNGLDPEKVQTLDPAALDWMQVYRILLSW